MTGTQRHAEPAEDDGDAAESHQIRPSAQLATAGKVKVLMRTGVAQQAQLIRGEDLGRVGATPNGHEGLGDRWMKLGAAPALDLFERFVVSQATALERTIRRHRVEAVGHDQEVRGEWEVGELRAVIARAVVALPVILDRLRLGGREAEALQQARREARSPPDCGPLGVVQLAGLAEDGCVDGDLAEVVQPAGPPEA